jgi:hypothetical protein
MRNLAGALDFVIDIRQQDGDLEILTFEDFIFQIASRRTLLRDDRLADHRFRLPQYGVELSRIAAVAITIRQRMSCDAVTAPGKAEPKPA